MKYVNPIGIDNPPVISFASGDDKKIIDLIGKVFKPNADNFPFETTGDWSIDRVNFTEIDDISDKNLSKYKSSTTYRHLKFTSEADKEALPEGLVVAFEDEVFDGPNNIQIGEMLVKQELEVADEHIKYHEDDDDDKVSTMSEWRKYRRDLRKYKKNSFIEEEKPVRPE
jgi:hypothetical protein